MDWRVAREDTVREILREAELYISAQVQLSIAADQRAVTVSGAIATILTAITAAGLAAFLSSSPNFDIVYAATVSGTIMMIALCCAIYAARPVPFRPPGNCPEMWYDDDFGVKINIQLGHQAEIYNAFIKENNATLARNAVWIRLSLFLTVAAPIAGVLVAVL
ncbi:hypothetical protein [Magnetospirillum fulvum]|uniref:hypothetical protein n=1 Tax=Magnetospirillum fulvum TaxID=1082 RepID=UPI0012DE70B5|nr:hypothetical protein [Magnetospirillum fulvum]